MRSLCHWEYFYFIKRYMKEIFLLFEFIYCQFLSSFKISNLEKQIPKMHEAENISFGKQFFWNCKPYHKWQDISAIFRNVSMLYPALSHSFYLYTMFCITKCWKKYRLQHKLLKHIVFYALQMKSVATFLQMVGMLFSKNIIHVLWHWYMMRRSKYLM